MDNYDLERVRDITVCPSCGMSLYFSEGTVSCERCGCCYPVRNGILSFIPEESDCWQNFFTDKLDAALDESQAVGYACEKNFDLVRNAVKRMVGSPSKMMILDIGCGHGLLSDWLSENNNVVGVDFVLEMLIRAQKRGLIPIHANALNIPLKKGSFDLVMSIEVIQSIENVQAFVSYLSEFVNRKGRIIISGLNAHSGLRRVRRAIKKLLGKKDHSCSPMLWDPLYLAGLFSKMGFEVEIGYTFFPFSRFVVEKAGEFRKHKMATNFFISATKTDG